MWTVSPKPRSQSKKKKKKKKNRDLVDQKHNGEVIQKDISKMEWTIEEAEVAARERIVWRHLLSLAVGAVMHDANQ